jgi:hypothetical protein
LLCLSHVRKFRKTPLIVSHRHPARPPPAPSRDDENGGDDRPILRRPDGSFAPGTAPGPGRPPLIAIRDRLSKALEKHARAEHAIEAYDVLVRHVRRGSLRAAIEYLRAFGGLLDSKEGQAHVNATAIKIVIGVDEDRL